MVTVGELKDLLSGLPDNMPVVISDCNDGHMHVHGVDDESWVYDDNITERYFIVYGDVDVDQKVQVAVIY